MEKPRAWRGKYRFRRHPSASVSFRGRPWTSATCVIEDGRRTVWTYDGGQRKIHLNGRKLGRAGGISSVSFRKIPRTPGEIRTTFGRKMEAGGLRGGTEENRPKYQKPGQEGEIIHPSASVSFRGRPWTSAGCAGGRWKMEAGELRRNTEKDPHKWQKLGRDG